MTDPGLQCSSADPLWPKCFCSSSHDVQWPVSPPCQRSQCAGAQGHMLLMLPSPGPLLSPRQLSASSHKGTRSHGNGWWATAGCWSFERSCRMPWSLRGESKWVKENKMRNHQLYMINTIKVLNQKHKLYIFYLLHNILLLPQYILTLFLVSQFLPGMNPTTGNEKHVFFPHNQPLPVELTSLQESTLVCNRLTQYVFMS